MRDGWMRGRPRRRRRRNECRIGEECKNWRTCTMRFPFMRKEEDKTMEEEEEEGEQYTEYLAGRPL